jgi:hypothetical protein
MQPKEELVSTVLLWKVAGQQQHVETQRVRAK